MTKEQFEKQYGEQLKLSGKKWMLMSPKANKENNLVVISGYKEIDFDYLYFIYKDEVWEMDLMHGMRFYNEEIYTTKELFKLCLSSKKNIQYTPTYNRILYRDTGVKGQIIVTLDYFAAKIKSVLDPVTTIPVSEEVQKTNSIAPKTIRDLEIFLKELGYHSSIINYVCDNIKEDGMCINGEWVMDYIDVMIEDARFDEEDKQRKLFTESKIEEYLEFGELNSKKKIREFETGAVRDVDDEKEDYVESLSWLALRRYSKYMKTQEVKYGKGNWKKGIPIEEYEKSLMRHIQKYFANKYEDAELEMEVDHLGAAFFNLQGIIHETEKINGTN